MKGYYFDCNVRYVRPVPAALFGILVVALSAVLPRDGSAQGVDDTALADEANGSEWLGYGRTYSEQRFSPLKQVDTSNVAQLEVDWFLDLPDAGGLISTPLVANGVMYFTGSKNVVRAVNAATGKLIWQYDPRTAEVAGDRMRLAFLHGGRGIAMWKGKVYAATADGRLIALDAKSGRELWSVMTIDPDQPLYIVGTPKAFKGKVLVGNAGSEIGGTRGYVTAYDAETGQQKWRFYVVPGNPADGFENKAMEMAAKTWTGEWWKYGGGGHPWGDGFTYDPEFNTVYIGTGNGTPWNRKIRSPGGGDNLFLSSIVALDADTGEYRWHYQTTPGEQWDYSSTADIVLADLTIDGRPVKAILHAPKNGFFYVIDRASGKLISAEPFAEVSWATRVDLKTGRPVEVPGARYEDGRAEVIPSDWGAHNWPPMSFNPLTGLVYIPTMNERYIFSDEGIDLESWEPPRWLEETRSWGMGVNVESIGQPWGSLQAWDPTLQKQVWEVKLPYVWSPGTLTTAGNLVFQGRAKGELVAYDATDGGVLWRHPMGLGIAAPPITYAIDGRQYIALLVGWGGGWAALRGAGLGWRYGRHMRRVVAFSLKGEAAFPALPPPEPAVPIVDADFAVNDALAQEGASLYGQCSFCHGGAVVSGGVAPDLRASPIVCSTTSCDTHASLVAASAGCARTCGFSVIAAGKVPVKSLAQSVR